MKLVSPTMILTRSAAAYTTLSLLVGMDHGQAIAAEHIGTALLFSGGTFLFVAMHAITDLAGAQADLVDAQDLESTSATKHEVLGKFARIVLVVLGAWTPRILQKIVIALGGGHHH